MARLDNQDKQASQKIHARVRQLKSQGYSEKDALRIAQREIKPVYSSYSSYARSKNYKKYGR